MRTQLAARDNMRCVGGFCLATIARITPILEYGYMKGVSLPFGIVPND